MPSLENPSTAPAGSARPARKHTAGAFDIRNVIAMLLGLYAVILVACSFLLDPGSNPETSQLKSATDNLWAGLALGAVAIAFFLWSKSKPIVVDESALPSADGATDPASPVH